MLSVHVFIVCSYFGLCKSGVNDIWEAFLVIKTFTNLATVAEARSCNREISERVELPLRVAIY